MQFSSHNPTSLIRAPWYKRVFGRASTAGLDYAKDNAFQERAKKSNNMDNQNIWEVDADNHCMLFDERHTPMQKTMTFTVCANGSLADQIFYIAERAMTITGITEIHKTAGTNGSAVTSVIRKISSGGSATISAGTALMTNTFNMKGTANTLQTATLPTNDDGSLNLTTLTLAAGDMLAIDFTGTLTTLAGVVVTVTAIPAQKGHVAVYQFEANGGIATQTFFFALRPMTISAVYEVHRVKGSDAGAVTLDVTHETGTTAMGGGTTVLSAPFSAKATAMTVQTGALTATAADLALAAGDRLSVVLTGTPTALAGVVIIVVFAPTERRKEINFSLLSNTDLDVDQCIFTADRDYEVYDVGCVYDVASTSVKINVTVDTGTTAPGAGTALLTDNTNAGFDTNATARTAYYGTITSVVHNKLLPAGGRLGLKHTGTKGSLAGLSLTVSLIPR